MKKLWIFTAFLGMGFMAQSQITFIKNYDGGYNDSDEGHCVIQTSDGGYAMTGATWIGDTVSWYNIALAKTDENGDTLWTRSFGDVHDGGLFRDTNH